MSSTSAPAKPLSRPVVTVEEAAFSAIVLHALKYPLSSVNGILVGTRSSKTSDASMDIVVSRVAPMIHTHTCLPGQMEFALALLAERLKELNEGGSSALEIVGYYHCNERKGDVDLGAVARRVADGVGAVALVLDAEALEARLEGSAEAAPLVLLTKSSSGRGSWNVEGKGSVLVPCLGEASWAERLRVSVADEYGGVHDFEEHMEDVSIDFLH
jgi:hypothetical protein